MRIFITGANGWIGSAIVHELRQANHAVVGLVRSPDKGARLAAAGAEVLVGSLGDLDVLRRGAEGADGVIHTAFGLDLAEIDRLAAEDTRAIETFGEVFAGSERCLVVTSGVFMTPPGEVFQEAERPGLVPGFPRASEQTAFAVAAKGVRACVVRNPRSVHGPGETHGFVPMLAAVARAKGVSAYVGDGANLWPSVHRLDAARVFCRAVERGARGAAYHAIAEQGVPFRAIAEAIGRQLGLPAKSLTPAEAEGHFGPLASWVAGNGPASSVWTRQALDWTPREVGLVADIERPDYSDPRRAQPAAA